jgi:integrase
VSLYKRGEFYWYKFMWNGKLIRESTRQGNDKVARKMEAAHRTALAQGLVGIRERKPAPTLAEFLKTDFLPFVEAHFADKPNTRDYYQYAADSLTSSKLGKRRIDEITSQHAAAYAATHAMWSPSTINRDLRTLRRALNLAAEWAKLDKAPKIQLARGERQRDRVLSPDEVNRYLRACPHRDWHDAALLTVATGMRPADEVCRLRWEAVELNGQGGRIRIDNAKTLAGQRVIPLKPEVYEHFGIPNPATLLRERHVAQGQPKSGWVFPRPSQSGHLTENTYKLWHAKALTALATANAKDTNAKKIDPLRAILSAAYISDLGGAAPRRICASEVGRTHIDQDNSEICSSRRKDLRGRIIATGWAQNWAHSKGACRTVGF